ncbi:hypothetical protein G6F57_006107 [Rhizopus arrhizus]|uniref:N-acetyltransferase domain-containing protein n=1 Tax=Rhizopus oryzae TaxID=64495 RepID=A0A9P6X9V9_RHIOR|nr:hypothetical protein G6F23_008503 [Rhizopus arrhizus]KAG1424569.1 hypothetical protein G6F58_002313 [Rhizopus delemar]KAG0763638.1 hypothetical protein G6F24_005850 [Rhizopus arrhizus]KAG0793093.1 hypothetical protein G6F21_003866 [Rhizopus arrhizus]KAG0801968.1 hypothetical protein G6F22_000719 [Rhizopus arrhizus]
MSSAYGHIHKPNSDFDLNSILPIRKVLKDGQIGYIQKVDVNNKPLVSYLHQRFNKEIEDGLTYPQENLLDDSQFESYFLGYDAFVMSRDSLIELGDNDFNEKVMGMFYIKPNYPGRCSHICNGGFFVMEHFRGIGVGIAMGEAFKVLVPAIGYKASVFNLVFENNVASVAIWKKLGFQQVGRIPKAGRLRNSPDKLVDALIFYHDFSQ